MRGDLVGPKSPFEHQPGGDALVNRTDVLLGLSARNRGELAEGSGEVEKRGKRIVRPSVASGAWL